MARMRLSGSSLQRIIQNVLGESSNLHSKPAEMIEKLKKINNFLESWGIDYEVVITEKNETGEDIDLSYRLRHTETGEFRDLNLYSVHFEEIRRIEDLVKKNLNLPLPYGSINFSLPGPAVGGSCNDAMVVTLTLDTPVGSGWGVLLYELAIERAKEYTGADEHRGGLTSDRLEVSQAAQDVWEKYFKRSDIKNYQLDNLKNELTPEPEDNCRMPLSVKGPPDGPLGLKNNALAKRYVAQGTRTLESVRDLGLYWRVD